MYFQVLGDHGFVGLGMFLAILASTYFNNRSNMKYGRREGYAWYARLASALNLSLIGYGITGANVSLAYFDLLYAVFGLVAVMQMYRPELLRASFPAASKQEARMQYA
ncbi:MAG: hypothetical protein RIC89_05780 [Pseudomonadales bacterium]